MKNLLSFLLPAAILLSGCTQEELRNSQPDFQDGRTFTASFEQDRTRTYVEDGNLLRWTAGDQISLFDGNTLNRQYKFDGETGDNSGTFSIVSKPFGTGNALSANYSVYPYSSDVKITETGVITATLPAEQSYAYDSFGLSANTMVAVTKDIDDTFLKFKNVCGYLKIRLYGDDITVKSISLTGNDNEGLAGKASITPAYGDEPKVVMSDEATSSITLNCGEGVKIGSTAETATAFWIAVPPTTFERGFEITVTDINGNTFTKSTSNEITVERNVIKPMKAFEAKLEAAKPANNEIWYTTTDSKVVQPYDVNVLDANIISNTYENGKGIITFDDEITTIGDYAFRWCNFTSVTIPDCVISIGNGAFANCSSLKEFRGKYASDDGRCLIADGVLKAFAPAELTEYTINDCVIVIGGDSFVNCDKLKSVTIGKSVTAIGDYAFAYCDALIDVIIPDSVITIGEAAFFFCQKLTSLTIGNNVASIGKAAVAMCSLKCFKGKYASEDGRSLIKDNIIVAYANASGSEYTIPDTITMIGDYAFYCPILTKIVIPDSVTAIGEYAFYNGNFSSLYCKAITPPALGPYSFYQVNVKSVYVPAESVDIYRAADYWKDLNIVEEESSIKAVDLGLSVKWASCNVGASSPEKSGGYYSWGETEEKSNYDHTTYLWSNCDKMDWKMTKYCNNIEFGTVDSKMVLELEDDVANLKWGDGWRMPTIDEFQELLNNCSWEWTSMNGVNGYQISGNGNNIFLPAAGCRYYDEMEVRYFSELGAYWSASLNDKSSTSAWGFSFEETDIYEKDSVSRYPGSTVRPVKE